MCANAVPITSAVRRPRLQRGRQQDVGGGAVAAPHPPRAHGHRRRTERADGAFARVPPFGQRAAAARAAHDGVGEPGLGVLGSADDDHCRTLRPRCISVAYHTPDQGRGQFVLGATAFGSVPSLAGDAAPTRHDARVVRYGAGAHRLHHLRRNIGGADESPQPEPSATSEVTERPSVVVIQRDAQHTRCETRNETSRPAAT